MEESKVKDPNNYIQLSLSIQKFLSSEELIMPLDLPLSFSNFLSLEHDWSDREFNIFDL